MGRITKNKLLVASPLAFVCALVACNPSGDSHEHEHHDHDHEHAHEEAARGPHQGRTFSCGDVSGELAIFEHGSAPHFRLYTTQDGTLVPPKEVSASVTLKRLGDVVDQVSFEPVGDFLESREEIDEPHSFDVSIRVASRGQSCDWSYSSYEGRTTIPEDVAKRSGITTEPAGPRNIVTTLLTRGKILPSEHRIAHIIPRFSGVVREGRKHIGDPVAKGEVVAVVESNQSLQPFEVKSQLAGTVISGHLIVGEFVPENQWIFVVADLSVVWADLFVPLRNAKKVAVGQVARISSVHSEASVEGRVTYVAPYADEKSQSRLVRVELPNPEAVFLPGAQVTGDVVIDDAQVPVAVRRDAVHRFGAWEVVFKRSGDTYEASPLELGRSDGEWVEVKSGLSAGEEYVASNAFIVKADILKAGAAHDH